MKKILLLGMISMCSFFYTQTMHLYGGRNHDVYLGCLNCGKYDSNSIWNVYSNYGSKYSSTSIWNKYGNYGGKYSDTSPWNSYASYPPVVVDKNGNFYGYLTANKYKDKRANFNLAKYLYEYYDDIQEDVSKWYERIFN